MHIIYSDCNSPFHRPNFGLPPTTFRPWTHGNPAEGTNCVPLGVPSLVMTGYPMMDSHGTRFGIFTGTNFVYLPDHYNPLSHRIHGTGIFTYIYHQNQPNESRYIIHGSYGYSYLRGWPMSLVIFFFDIT